MNGAIAEPCVSTISPPNSSIRMRIGTNQYFLRTRRNIQNSCRNDNMHTSELLFHRVRRRSWRLARDPVACRRRVAAQTQRVFAGPAHENAYGRDGRVEQNHQNDRTDGLGQEETELEPRAIEGPQSCGP